jgi:hypothetical protein
MVLETAKQHYKNWTGEPEFKRFHWWEAVRHQTKWRVRSASSSTTDLSLSSSDSATEVEVTRLIDQERAKAAARKRKGKENSTSQSESLSVVGDIISTLKKLSAPFTKAQLCKQHNKLKDRSTANMNKDQLESHCETQKFIQSDIQFAQRNTVDVEDEDDE